MRNATASWRTNARRQSGGGPDASDGPGLESPGGAESVRASSVIAAGWAVSALASPTKYTRSLRLVAPRGGTELVILDQTVTIQAPVDKVWDFVNDMEAVSRCVPGVESFQKVDDETYLGALKVKVGPIGVTLNGKVIVVERDRENLRARMQVQAAEKRLNSAVNAHATLTAVPRAENETELQIHTESSILGKLGEFGQAVMRRKADQIVEEFARNMAKAINATA
jgi:carbon monoxide dehydrogenase subunit G